MLRFGGYKACMFIRNTVVKEYSDRCTAQSKQLPEREEMCAVCVSMSNI